MEIIHISKLKPGTAEKNSSCIGLPAGPEHMPVRGRCTAQTTKIQKVADMSNHN